MNAMSPPRRRPLRVAVAGFGAIGAKLAATLDEGLSGYELTAVSARDKQRAGRQVATFRNPVPVLDLHELEPVADLVVECAPAALLPAIAEPFLKVAKNVVLVSAGALLSHDHLVRLAAQHGGQIIVPTGALIGLDAVLAAAEGEIASIRMVTRKPVRGLVGAPYLQEHGICIENIKEPVRIFNGTAREAAVGFPANLNVAVALSLAGIGPDRTMLEIWADPAIERNTHRIEVEADSARFSMTIENVPSENPKTGRITPLSVIATLRKLAAPLRIGT
ncbi:aspartate dehydrogenase [Pseudoroseomonas globiformis]|uniref:L-aspartate dehydrogenase n=1 Tax=Teichococcus globiformis TaxID=2307229 RepID=A0ABV7G3U9_9PROT